MGFVARVDSVMNVGGRGRDDYGLWGLTAGGCDQHGHQYRADARAAGCSPHHPGRAQSLRGPGARPAHESGCRRVQSDRRRGAQGVRTVGPQWQMLEGVLATAPSPGGTQGSHMEFNSIEGTRVQTVGSNAEMPRRGICSMPL